LKSTPSADVINKNCFEGLTTADHVVQEPGQTFTVFQHQATSAGVFIGLNYAETILISVLFDGRSLTPQ
jgi:hypothetical protein